MRCALSTLNLLPMPSSEGKSTLQMLCRSLIEYLSGSPTRRRLLNLFCKCSNYSPMRASTTADDLIFDWRVSFSVSKCATMCSSSSNLHERVFLLAVCLEIPGLCLPASPASQGLCVLPLLWLVSYSLCMALRRDCLHPPYILLKPYHLPMRRGAGRHLGFALCAYCSLLCAQFLPTTELVPFH